MNCAEFKEQAGGWALEALDDAEQRACREHLAQPGPHEGCVELARRYERVVAALGRTGGRVLVPKAVWAAIEARIGASKRSRVLPALAWAAAACGLLASLWQSHRAEESARAKRRGDVALMTSHTETDRAVAERGECMRALEQAQKSGALARKALDLLEQPDTRLISMKPTGTGSYRATSIYAQAARQAFVLSTSLAPIPDKDFELWVIHPGKAPAPAGFLRFDESGVAIGELSAELLSETPAAFAVSLEPRGGRPTPTDVIMVGALGG